MDKVFSSNIWKFSKNYAKIPKNSELSIMKRKKMEKLSEVSIQQEFNTTWMKLNNWKLLELRFFFASSFQNFSTKPNHKIQSHWSLYIIGICHNSLWTTISIGDRQKLSMNLPTMQIFASNILVRWVSKCGLLSMNRSLS